MSQSSRNTILNCLKPTVTSRAGLSQCGAESRVDNYSKKHSSGLLAQFKEELTIQTGVLIEASSAVDAEAALAKLLTDEDIQKVMVSNGTFSFLLENACSIAGVQMMHFASFASGPAYKEAVFSEVDAGITTADYAVAESGSLLIFHTKDNPRLLSLAPEIHIAVIHKSKLIHRYEDAEVFQTDQKELPSQLTLITGPSMTADIQATPFRGMHGPKKLFVLMLTF